MFVCQAPVSGDSPKAAQLSQLLNATREEMVEAERAFLTDVTALLEEVTPQMEEISLLRYVSKEASGVRRVGVC